MKTIKQIADAIGVSKQAVYKKIKTEPLSTSLQEFMTTIDNALHIVDEGESLIKAAFIKETVSTVSTNSVDNMTEKLIESLQGQITTLTEQNKDLRGQLDRERQHSLKQVDRITELAADMAKLASNAQQLHAMENVKPQLAIEDEKKRSFFSKLFLRNAKNGQ